MKSKYDIYDSSVEIGNIFEKLRQLSDEISEMSENITDENVSKIDAKKIERSIVREVFSLKCKEHIKGLDKIMNRNQS